MHEGDAILGIFLATYSSKGDYLPLRYPMSELDYEYTESLLKEAKAKKRTLRADKCNGAAATEAEAEEPDSGIATSADKPLADTSSAAATVAPITTSTVKDGAPSRNDSFSSIANAGSNPVTPGSAAPSTTTVPVSSTKTNGRGDSKPRNTPGAAATSEFTDTSRQESDRGTVKKSYLEQNVHGFETKFLAQLFSPRPSMSDQRFQVAIDNVLFVGHPLRDDPKEKTRDPDYYDTEQDDTETMSRLADYDGWKVKSDNMLRPGSNQQGTRLLADLGLISLMLNREPSETGESAISEGERAVRDSKEWKRRGYWKRVYPKLFHVVFMLDNTVSDIELLADRIYDHVIKRLTKTLMVEQMESDYVLTQSRVIRSLNDLAQSENHSPTRYLQDIMHRSTLAANLIELYNGLRKGELVNLHIRNRIMLSLQIPRGPQLERSLPAPRPRAFLNTEYSTTGYNSVNPAEASVSASTTHTPRPDTPADAATATRSVAPAIQEYWGPIVFSHDVGSKIHISSNSIAHGATIHGLPSKLSLLTGNMGSTHGSQGIVVTGRELQPREHCGYPHIEPYHAILLLEDAASLKHRLLYSDASPTLLAVIEKASPMRPLLTLHSMVDCSFAQLCRFVAHLVYWNIARLICPVSLSFTYVPTATKLSHSLLERFNAQSYSLCTLPQMLKAMDPPRPAAQVLDSILASKLTAADYTSAGHDKSELNLRGFKPEFRDMLVFMLREGTIAQYHTWPVVLVPNYVKFNLSEEQFVHLSFAWFRTLHSEHPDLLGAFPEALLNKSEFECWTVDENHEQTDIELVVHAAREAENKVMLCRVMRKLALRRIRDVLSTKRQGKYGAELQRIDKQIADEEDKVHAFCNRIEQESMDVWVKTKAQHDSVLEQARQERLQERRAHGKDIPKSEATADSSSLYKWYEFVKRDPDLGEFAREIVGKYVSFVPTDPPPHRTESERRYLHRLVRGRPSSQQDWFHRHSHLFTGNNHLVKLLGGDQVPIARIEAMLQEFDGAVLLPQHI
ncbi:Nitrogen permease regulator 3 [Coemansia sp. RSA 1752]|nr:Nitrogen permease regulator 3 [Coemansia sp. RSA 1752]KAJ1788073.1 Nitrogen permease regulator 3 [Coemansia sp. RSA 1938]